MTRPKYPQKPLHGPELRVCANENCRRPFNPALRTGLARSRGLCPACNASVVSKCGWALDKKLYDECQAANAAEPKFRAGGCKAKERGEPSESEQYEIEQLAKLAKKPLRVPYVPSARGEGRKRGGPATGNEGGNR